MESANEERFSDHHVRIIEMLADVAAIAIIDSKFSEQMDRMSKIVTNSSLSEVIEEISRQAKDTLGAHNCDYWHWIDSDFNHPDGGKSTRGSAQPRILSKYGKSGISEWLLVEGTNLKQPAKAALVTELSLKKKSYKLEIVTQGESGLKMGPPPPDSMRQLDEEPNPNMDMQTRSEVGIPLKFHEGYNGVLWIKWHNDHKFTLEEFPFIERFANHAAFAFHINEIMKGPREKASRSVLSDIFGEKASTISKNILDPVFVDVVTVLFTDIRASTKVMDVLSGTNSGKELFVTIIKDIYENSARIVHEHGGGLATFLGDGVMAIFGHPIEKDKDPSPGPYVRNAFMSALGIKEYFEKMLPVWKQSIIDESRGRVYPDEFGMGIGIHSDSAVVGNFAKGDGCVYTAIGRAPTIASRIQDKAKRGGLYNVPEPYWPSGCGEPEPVIILCSDFLKRHFENDAIIELVPLLRSVDIKGLLGDYNLAVVRQKKPGEKD